MSTNAPQSRSVVSPAGYCPHCDYQVLGPGVCSECGKDVSAEQIRSLPRRKRRIRWVKRITVATLLVALVVGGRLIYTKKLYWRILPNSMVIEAYPTDLVAVAEVRRRLANGWFWDDEIVELVDRSFIFDFEMRSPRPHDIPISFVISLRSIKNTTPFFRHSVDRFNRYLDVSSCIVDDKAVLISCSKSTHSTMGGLFQSDSSGEFQVQDALKPGTYQFSIDVGFHVNAFSSKINAVYPSLIDKRFNKPFETTLVIEEESLFAKISEDQSDEMKAVLSDSIKLVLCKHQKGMIAIDLCFDAPQENYYFDGTLKIRHASDRNSSTSKELQFSPSSRQEFRQILLWNGMSEIDYWFSFELVPDFIQGFNAGETVSSAFILNWEDISIHDIPSIDDEPWDGCQTCLLPYSRTSDKIRPLVPRKN